MNRIFSRFGLCYNFTILTFFTTLLYTNSICHARDTDFHNALSLQGFTGLLNVPSAEVTTEGTFYGLYSNQIDQKWRGKAPRQDNYLASIGLFSFLEFGGRLTDAPTKAHVRDLSANIKMKVPFIPEKQYFPSVAFGIQDIGGGSTNLRTSYVVATEELWRLRLSLGYGNGPNRMKGAFGGGELKTFSWLYLIGEYDGNDTNVGARIITPEIFGIPVNLQLTAKTSLDYRPGNFDLALGMQFPLGIPHFNRQPLPVSHEDAPAAGEPAQKAEAADQEMAPKTEDDGSTSATTSALLLVVEKLRDVGFQNIRVGHRAAKLVVIEFENSRYNQNEIDAVGVVAGIAASTMPPAADSLRLVVMKKALPIYQVEMSLPLLREFLRDARTEPGLRDNIKFSPDVTDTSNISYVTERTYTSALKTSLVLFPGLRTFVGTEVGVFDYLLSLKPELTLNAWRGAQVLARWDIPVTWSKNFNDGETFAGFRKEARTERVMLFQALKPAPTVMLNIGGGLILPDTHGVINEVRWSPSGAHRFSLRHAYADDSSQGLTREVYLGSYRYYYSPKELYLEGTAGKFWDQDKGYTVQMKRFFGDTAVSIYFKYGTTPSDHQHVKIGGVQFALPLTPRRDMKQDPVQLRGPDEWAYAQETVIASHGERNSLGHSIGVVPVATYNLDHTFYNRDRLSEEYLKEHLLRLRDAYATFELKL